MTLWNCIPMMDKIEILNGKPCLSWLLDSFSCSLTVSLLVNGAIQVGIGSNLDIVKGEVADLVKLW